MTPIELPQHRILLPIVDSIGRAGPVLHVDLAQLTGALDELGFTVLPTSTYERLVERARPQRSGRMRRFLWHVRPR